MSPFMTDLVPSDSGVYDNSALETAKERFQTVLVGDVSQKKQPEAEPKSDGPRCSVQLIEVADHLL